MKSVVSDVGPVILCLSDDLDFYTAWRLREEIRDVLGEGSKGLIVSLEDVPFMDSTGLGALAGGWKQARAKEVTRLRPTLHDPRPPNYVLPRWNATRRRHHPHGPESTIGLGKV